MSLAQEEHDWWQKRLAASREVMAKTFKEMLREAIAANKDPAERKRLESADCTIVFEEPGVQP